MEGTKLSNIDVILKKDEILLGEEILCANCSYNVEYVASETNSLYYYCKKCGFNKAVVEKHFSLDILLKNIQKRLNDTFSINSNNILVNISRIDSEVVLTINNTECNRLKFLCKLNDKEKRILRYTIEDLIEDTLGEGKMKSIINIEL